MKHIYQALLSYGKKNPVQAGTHLLFILTHAEENGKIPAPKNLVNEYMKEFNGGPRQFYRSLKFLVGVGAIKKLSPGNYKIADLFCLKQHGETT